MFGSSSAPISEDAAVPATADDQAPGMSKDDDNTPRSSGDAPDSAASSRKSSADDVTASTGERKRRSSGVSRARDMFSSAKQSLHLHGGASTATEKPQSPIQKLSKTDPALGVPQGSHNNSAGESAPTAKSTFRVGVTEDKNKKCRRTMEDTHAYLYNFLSTPAAGAEASSTTDSDVPIADPADIVETDNGYFAIFDGHAGTFAADWCGKKLHHVLEDTIRKNPNTPIPELLDQTFTSVDQQLEKLPLKNSGCTAVTAVLRWEDRVPNPASATGSTYLNQAAAKASSDAATTTATAGENIQSQTHADITTADPNVGVSETKLRDSATRQRVLYTANVGDARIVLCRNGRALRLSYDHKGSDENEGRRVANAGGLILNNRVNGVLAVTRALGDAYMKDLVTGHPYTTETVIQPDQDEFIILACDGLWDVCTDQEAVDLIRSTSDPQTASKQLVDHALARFSTDNLSCMIVRFDNDALKKRRAEAAIGVDDVSSAMAGGDGGNGHRPSEAQAIVGEIKRQLEESSSGELAPTVTGTAAVEAREAGLDPSAAVAGLPTSGAASVSQQKKEEPGPELNPQALKAAREKAERSQEKVARAEG